MLPSFLKPYPSFLGFFFALLSFLSFACRSCVNRSVTITLGLACLVHPASLTSATEVRCTTYPSRSLFSRTIKMTVTRSNLSRLLHVCVGGWKNHSHILVPFQLFNSLFSTVIIMQTLNVIPSFACLCTVFYSFGSLTSRVLLDSELQEHWEHHFCRRTQQTSSYISKDIYICRITGTQITIQICGETRWPIRYLH